MKKVFNVLIFTSLLMSFQLLSFGYSYGQTGDAPTTSDIKPASIVPSGTADGSGRCVIVCPPGGVDEAELCGTDINGGCNMAAPQFTQVSPSDVICGGTWFNGNTRDTDWFEMVLTERSTVTMTLNCDAASTLFGILEQAVPGLAGCDNITGLFSVFDYALACTETSVQATLDPGTYYFFVGLDFSGPIYDCAARNPVAYTIQFTAVPPIPLSNWPIYLGVFLIAAFMVFRYRRRLA